MRSTNASFSDSSRRLWDFSDRVAELAPEESPFFVYLSKVGKVPTSDSLPLYQNKIHKTSKRYQEKINTVLRNLTANSPSKRMIEVGDQPIDKKRISKIQKRAEKIISQIKAKSSPRTTMTKVERKGY